MSQKQFGTQGGFAISAHVHATTVGDEVTTAQAFKVMQVLYESIINIKRFRIRKLEIHFRTRNGEETLSPTGNKLPAHVSSYLDMAAAELKGLLVKTATFIIEPKKAKQTQKKEKMARNNGVPRRHRRRHFAYARAH